MLQKTLHVHLLWSLYLFLFSHFLPWRDFCRKRKWKKVSCSCLGGGAASQLLSELMDSWRVPVSAGVQELVGHFARGLVTRILPGAEDMADPFYQVRVGKQELSSRPCPTPLCCSRVSDGQHHTGFSELI